MTKCPTNIFPQSLITVEQNKNKKLQRQRESVTQTNTPLNSVIQILSLSQPPFLSPSSFCSVFSAIAVYFAGTLIQIFQKVEDCVDEHTIEEQLSGQSGWISTPNGGRDKPMDYDDNDFHSQNLHLVGEGNQKYPPVLPPYVIPKFEFDDSLQGHLKFDTLVETEVFLGIENNESNHWIGDFSRGGSGIEFSSSAAESCSISRRNNVWSEATSSESVEMLLKSVGQEEVIPSETVILNLDACDELRCLTKQMEPRLKNNEDMCSEAHDVTGLQSTLPSNEIPRPFYGQPHVEVSVQIQQGDLHIDGSSNNLDTNFADRKSDDENRIEGDSSAKERLDVKSQENTFALGMQVDNTVTSVHGHAPSSTQLNYEGAQRKVNDVDKDNPDCHISGKEPEMDNQNVVRDVIDNCTCHDVKPDCLASVVENVVEVSATETALINVKESSSNVVMDHSDQHLVVSCSTSHFSTVSVVIHKCEDVIIGEGTDLFGVQPNQISEQELPSVSFKSNTFVRHIGAEIDSVLEPEMNNDDKATKEEIINEEVLGSGKPLNNSSLLGKAEASLPSIEDAMVSEGEGHEISSSHGGSISSIVTIANFSSDVHCENHVTDDSKGVHDSLEVSRETLSSEDQVSPSIMSEAAHKNEDIKSCFNVGCHNQDVSVNGREITSLSDDYSNVDSKVGERMDHGVGSSSFGEGITQVKDVKPENSNAAFSDASDAAPLPFKDGVKMDVDPKEDQMTSSTGIRLTQLDRTDEAAATEASLSYPIVSSRVETGQGPIVSEAEAGTQKVPQEQETSEAKEQETKEMDRCPVFSDASEKDGDVIEEMSLTQSEIGATAEKCITEKSKDASEIMTNNDETHTELGPVLLEETCITDVQNFRDSEVTVLYKDKNSGKTIKRSDNKFAGKALENQSDSLGSVSLPESHTKSDMQKDLVGHADCNKAVCVSSKPAEGTPEKVSTNEKAPAAEVVDGGANHVLSNTHEPKRNEVSRDNRMGSVGISSIAEFPKEDTVNDGKPFPFISAPKVSRRSSNSGLGRLDPKTTTPDISQASLVASGGEAVRRRTKGTPETKTRRSSAKAFGKDKKGIQVKEISIKQSGDKFSNVSPSTSENFHLMKSNEMQGYGHMEGSNTKPYFVVAASTSGLPDLNASGSQSALFQQPFTDSHQVQLRAQIFVYGTLIQGIAPEEAHMVSAFGGPGGSRSMWENAWRTCFERLCGKKSNAIDPETPLLPQSGTKASDQVTKQSSIQSKDISSPAGQFSTKGTQTIISPMMPLSSPLWSVPTLVGGTLQSNVMPRGSISNYQQSLSPLHPFQTPPTRCFVGNNAPWMSQASFRGPWVASPQSSLPEASTRFSAYPSIEPVQLNPVKETTTLQTSATKLVFSGPIVHTGDMRSGLAGATSVLCSKKVLTSSEQQSVGPKPRKRKKSSVSEECDQIVLQTLFQPQPVVESVLTSSLPMSDSVKTLAPTPFVSKAMSEKLIFPVSQVSSTDNLRKVDHDLLHRSNLSEETIGKLKETRKQAEDAATSAAAAVSRCQEIWNELDMQKNSGLSSNVEAKLESVAVQVAAAAAVAKAAAAAANVASSAALQAKLMADEAMISTTDGNSNGRSRTFSDEVSAVGKASPASILGSDDGAHSSTSIITAAREAARRRVEAASAASKRAENMDAIVKAAEIAAEAVSQAGTIVAMGDPFSLRELVEAGPQGYWKVPQLSSEPATISTDIIKDQSKGDTGEEGDTSKKNSNDRQSGKKETYNIAKEKSDGLTGVGKEPIDNHLRLTDVLSGSIMAGERDSGGKMGHKFSDLSKNISVVLESKIGSESSPLDENELGKATEISKSNSIKEDSQVEVFKDGEGHKAAWFAANVLSVKDGKAYVSYLDLHLDEGLGKQLKEWVELESKGDEAPKIRLARPITAVHYEGTRKRRRAATGGDLTWSVGDRVDAWITDSWWEGFVTEKNKKDETSLTVNFPAQGVTSIVKAWHLRPSLTWKDGQWVEWCNLRNVSSLESDMPKEKRPKLGSPAVEAEGKDKTSNSSDVDLGKLEETRLLDLSSNEKVFKIGKNTRTENKPYGTRTRRTGLLEGSRVKFGVPKPGKKRKFMEVSKHYVSDQATKTNEAIIPVKPGLIQHGTRGLRNTSKNDSKEKRVAESNLKRLKSGNQQIVSASSIPRKENLSSIAISAHDDETSKDRTRTKDSTSQVGTTSGNEDLTETGSHLTTGGAAGNSTVFSSAPPSDAPSKRVSSARTYQTNKGKLAPASGKLGIIEENKVSNDTPLETLGAVEPRRSNRKIQPTSRLLEGLQSSLIMSKIPFSHDRGHRSQK